MEKLIKVSALASVVLLAACGGNSNTSSSSGAARTANAEQIIAAATLCGNPAPVENLTPTCSTPGSADGNEPPCNPHLAQNAWSASHRNNFAQASSPLPGVTTPLKVNIDRTAMIAAPIVMNFSERDNAGAQAVWASTVGFTGEIVKLDAETLAPLDRFVPPGGGTVSTSGAYNMLDRDQHLIVGQSDSLQVYGDAVPGDRRSGIKQLTNFTLPAEARCGTRDDQLVGITMLPDGHVAFATKFGMIGVIPRQPEAMCAETLRVYSLNGDEACNDSNIADGDLEQVSNSIAADEKSAVYVVTSGAQYRLNWDGKQLSPKWRSAYEGAGSTGGGRLGGGSGSTPSLMGLPGDRDRFVVVTDGQPLMHLVLMWQDEIPSDWQPVKPGRDRRIACEIPVNFGDESAVESLSEQSVLVRGYSSVIVNNLFKLNSLLSFVPAQAQPFTQLVSGLSINRPSGLQRIDWDPATRTCKSVWTNPDISIPNGIPTMSAKTGQIFGIGSRTINGLDTWTLESIDFATGKSRFTIPSTPYPTDNSFFAGTTIGPDNSVWTGTFGGITRFQDCSDGQSCGRRTLSPLKHLPLSSLLP
jgi:hypothetical protein